MNLKEMTIELAQKHLGEKSAIFVDIRDPDSYKSGHIEDAIILNDSNISEFIEKADKSKTHIIYCYHGNSSKNAMLYLQSQGFEKVFSMIGGYTEWAMTSHKR